MKIFENFTVNNLYYRVGPTCKRLNSLIQNNPILTRKIVLYRILDIDQIISNFPHHNFLEIISIKLLTTDIVTDSIGAFDEICDLISRCNGYRLHTIKIKGALTQNKKVPIAKLRLSHIEKLIKSGGSAIRRLTLENLFIICDIDSNNSENGDDATDEDRDIEDEQADHKIDFGK